MRRRTTEWLLILSAVLTGCSLTPSKSVSLPDGAHGYSIDCAFQGEWAACMNKAAQLCGGKYTVVDRSRQASASGLGGDVQEMLVRCE